MRKPGLPKLLLLTLTVLCSAPALAWVPKLEETTARNVIDGAYGRRDTVATYLTLDLNVKDGKFAAGDGLVKAFDGGDACVADWIAKPADYVRGSRVGTITVSGQADQLYFQAQDARDSFRNLTVPDALGAELAGKRIADGELRVDVNVRGLPSEKARDAYMVRLRGPGGKMIAPTRKSYVNDWKPLDAAAPQSAPAPADKTAPAAAAPAPAKGPLQGTLVYYFKPLEAGIGASDKAEFLIRNENGDNPCAYSVTFDLSKFQ
ncbi:hypothetical protein [Deinococcus fonticola]|uniref:hypothetical protein n=1 Tax=Deinococcus fonticola TaxID=2528713 RepID=UPI0010755B0C|nr:hypothetical protein [Deinococcus fonticola]